MEAERLRLNEIPYFMPESALRHLTKYTMKRPTAEDILDFLTTNRYNVTLEDVSLLIRSYDADEDGALHPAELRRLLLSSSSINAFTRMPLVDPVGDMHSLGAGAV